MLGSRQQTWIVVDIGGRWIKCVRYVVLQGSVREAGSQLIDIQAEGLLSGEEVSAAIKRALRSAGEHPVAVVLPQEVAVSQVMDLPVPSASEGANQFEEEILELTGLSAERCVYDRNPLEPFGGYSNPQWITVAKEENLTRQLSPLLAQGLRVEAATTGGNALVASFRQTHPEVKDACLVDIGAKQTSLIRLRHGAPIQMASFNHGGESWTEALFERGNDGFEEVEARLFQENLFADPVLGATLQARVEAWSMRLLGQIDEWREELGMPEDDSVDSGGIYLFGGYSAVCGLREALAQSGNGRDWNIPDSYGIASTPVWSPTYGAVLMAAGISDLRASIVPRALAKMREHRLAVEKLQTGALALFVLVLVVLLGAIFKQQDRRDELLGANRTAAATLSEIRQAEALLEQRDELARQIEPFVRGQLNSLNSLETFRRIQRLHADFDFTLTRFADQESYFQGSDARAAASEVAELNAAGRIDGSSTVRTAVTAFVVELALPGSQAERLQALGAIVGLLREEPYFANVDRLVAETESSNSAMLSGVDETYALLLTLADEPALAPDGTEKGAGQ